MKVQELYGLIETNYQVNQRASLANGLYHYKHVGRLLGDLDAETLAPSKIEWFKAQRLKEGAARGTVNHELSLLRRGLNLAIQLELIARAPRVFLLQDTAARSGFLEPFEFLRLVRTLEVLDADVADVTQWLYLTGWRKEEALGLVWENVNHKDGIVVMPAARTKNRRARTLRLGEALKAILQRRHDAERGPYVFHRSGRRILDFRYTWKRAVRALGKPGLLVHDLRRSFARNAMLAGVPQRVIMEVGGWRTAYVFHRYAITDEKDCADALNAVSDFTNGKQKPGA